MVEFYKETIMGQVLSQVQSNKKNEVYFDQIDELLEDINEMEYLDVDVPVWRQQGVMVTDKHIDKKTADIDWVYVETADVKETSWLIGRLVDIYKPSKTDSYRLLTTIGYLLNIYGQKYDNLSDIFRMVTMTSTVFLHPDHIGLDRFKVHTIDLPPFGSEF